MKKKITAAVAVILVIFQIFALSSCDMLVDSLIEALETFDFNELTIVQGTEKPSGKETDDPYHYTDDPYYETEEQYGETEEQYIETEEQYIETEEQTVPVTEKPADRIPYSKTPAVYRYTLPKETFKDEIEKEASEIIDDSICKAIAALKVMKDDRHSDRTYPFDRDANGYIADLSNNERALYDKVVSYGRNFESFTIKADDYKGDLTNDYFGVFKALTQCNPDLASYFDLHPEIGGKFVGDDVVTFMKTVSDQYFDPYKDQNYTVREGKTTMAEVKRAAKLLDAIANRIVRFMPEGLTAYDKYYYLAAVLAEHVTYDLNAVNKFTAFGALVGGRAVCEGYATAYMLLCEKANLFCAYRNGIIRGDGHAWNMVKLDSGIYNVDVTWCDVSACYEKNFYKNFMKSDAAFKSNGHESMDGLPSTGTYEPCPYE